MAPTVFVSGRVLILATLAGAVTSFGSGRLIQAKVELATVTPFDIGDPDLAGFKLKLDVRLTNRSGQPLRAKAINPLGVLGTEPPSRNTLFRSR
jgi:hypothetical protein